MTSQLRLGNRYPPEHVHVAYAVGIAGGLSGHAPVPEHVDPSCDMGAAQARLSVSKLPLLSHRLTLEFDSV